MFSLHYMLQADYALNPWMAHYIPVHRPPAIIASHKPLDFSQ